MRIRSPSGWGLRKRVGEAAAAPLYANGKPQAGRPRARTPNSRRRSRCQRGTDPFPRRNNRDESINRSRIPEGGSFEMPFPAAGLRQIVSRETFVPTIALLRKADKPRQDTAGAASRQRRPCIPPRSEWRKSIEFGRTRLIEPARCASLESSRFHDLRRCQSKLASARATLFDTSEFNLFSPFGAEECAQGRPREGGREGG